MKQSSICTSGVTLQGIDPIIMTASAVLCVLDYAAPPLL
jgi:hypothetical protein